MAVEGNLQKLAILEPSLGSNYKTIEKVAGYIAAGVAPGTYSCLQNGGLVASGVGNSQLPSSIFLAAADFTDYAKVPKLKVRAQVACNATAVGTTTFSVGFYPVTVAGAAGLLAYTLGTVVPGSTVTPAAVASTVASADSGDFAIPADGQYLLAIVIGVASTAVNSVTGVTAQLMVHV